MIKASYVYAVLFFILIGLYSCNDRKKLKSGKRVHPTKLSLIKDAKTFNRRSLKDSRPVNFVKLLVGENSRIDVRQILKNPKYVFLETNQHSALGFIKKIIVENGKIYILDNKIAKCVYVFDLKGRFLYKVDKKLYCTQPDDMAVVDDKLFILNSSYLMLIYNSFTGGYVNRVVLPFFARSFSHNDNSKNIRFDFYTLYEKSKKYDRYNYWLINVDMTNMTVVDKDIEKGNGELVQGSSLNLFKDAKATYFTKSFNDTIFKIEPDVIRPVLYLNFSGRNLPPNYLNKTSVSKGISMDSLNYVSGISDLCMTPKWYYVAYHFKRNKYHVYIQRDNLNAMEGKSINDSMFAGALSPTPVGVYQGEFIYYVEPNKLMRVLSKADQMQKIYPGSNFKDSFKEARMMSEKLNSNSNPVLVFASP